MLRLLRTTPHGIELYVVLWVQDNGWLKQSFYSEEMARTFIAKSWPWLDMRKLKTEGKDWVSTEEVL